MTVAVRARSHNTMSVRVVKEDSGNFLLSGSVHARSHYAMAVRVVKEESSLYFCFELMYMQGHIMPCPFQLLCVRGYQIVFPLIRHTVDWELNNQCSIINYLCFLGLVK